MPDVRAIVDRSPFRLRFTPGSGAPVLSEVANSRPAAAVMAPTVDPVPPGTDLTPSGNLYAPLAFLVGQASVTQYDGLVWGGNPMSGTRSGIQYAARAVTAVARSGAGVTLTVSTNDPTGRTLSVGLTPQRNRAMRVTVRANPASGVAIMTDAFASPAGEAFYGFGGRHNALDQHGQVLTNWTEEENITGFGQAGTPAAVLFPNGPTAAYYPQAQFVSSAGYGFLLDQPEFSRFRMDSDQPGAWSVAANAPALDYVVAPGAARTSIATLTGITGRQPAPPLWALGPMLDRLVKNVGESQSDYTANVMADLVNVTRYRLPLTAYRLEGWGFASADEDGLLLIPEIAFADQTHVIATLRARGIHVLAYLRPWITPGSAPDRAGLTVRDASGQTYLTTSTTGTRIALLDFTNPAAVAFWKREVAKVFGLGFDGFMQDFGEDVVSGVRFDDGETGATMHNRYIDLYMQATRKELAAYERAHPERRLWFFNRAGFTGSARYEAANFPGDESTDWSQAAGLASSTEDMLSRAIGGAFGFGTDIGGYYDYTTPPTTKELFLRWAEWAALSPVFRLHGSGRTGTHTPWS